jgi:hypothetical protein
MITKSLFINSLVSSFVLVLAVIVFEIIFFFLVVEKDMETRSIRLINNDILCKLNINTDITCDIKPNPIPTSTSKPHKKLIDIIPNNIKEQIDTEIENLIDINKDKLKERRKKCLIVLFTCLISFTLITLLLMIYNRSIIDFNKLFGFVGLTLLITAVCEAMFYLFIFTKMKTINNPLLILQFFELLQKKD